MANINDIPVANMANAFPVRRYRKLGSKTSNGGAWLIAYNIAQQNRFKAILSTENMDENDESDRKLSKNHGETIKNPINTSTITSSPPKILDGFFLLKHCGVEDPSDLCSINISGCQLTDANSEDLTLFDNVIHVNAGENSLPIEKLKTFPELRELEMQLNELSNININIGEFSRLNALDLSYNCLNKNDILNLGALPRLRLLKLTGNDLTSLPSELGVVAPSSRHSYMYREKQEPQKIYYPSLEYLFLDSNHLTETAFPPLSGIKKLRYINMDNNEITCVPSISLLLKMRVSSAASQSKRRSMQPVSAGSERSSIISVDKKFDEEENKSIQSRHDSHITFEHAELPRHATVESIMGSSIISSSPTDDETQFPFYYLQSLSLANNCIETEEGLLSLAEYPQIKEVIIYGNPLLTKIKGNLPLLTKELIVARGIHLVRTNVEDELKSKKHRPRPIVNQRRKIPDVLPPIPKRRYPLSIEAPYYDFSQPAMTTQDNISVHPSNPSSHTVDESTTKMTEEVEEDDNGSTFFLTQQQDEFEPPSSVSTKRSAVNGEDSKQEEQTVQDKQVATFNNLPSKYKGFEEIATGLDDDDDNLSNNFPKGMQSSVRALKYALHHPLTYQEDEPTNYYKPNLRLGYNATGSTTASNKLDTALSTIHNDLNSMEGNLDHLLRRSDKEKDEAVRLLSRVQAKYEEFRETTLKSVASTCEALHEGLESTLETGTEITNMTPSASPDLYFKTTQHYSLKSPSTPNSD